MNVAVIVADEEGVGMEILAEYDRAAAFMGTTPDALRQKCESLGSACEMGHFGSDAAGLAQACGTWTTGTRLSEPRRSPFGREEALASLVRRFLRPSPRSTRTGPPDPPSRRSFGREKRATPKPP